MNRHSWIWLLLAVLFGGLATWHIYLMVQPDIVPPQFQFQPYKSVQTVLTYGPGLEHGKTIDPMEPFNQFGEKYRKFINEDFDRVVKDINRNKQISNRMAALGHILAFLTCLVSFWLSRKEYT